MTSQLKSLGIRAAGAAVLVATSYQFAFADTTTCDPLNGGIASGVNCTKPVGTPDTLFAANGVFSIIANTLIFLVGAISVIMLIIGGLRYVLSSGEASAVKGAKDTILYAIIGIIVAILAFAAVSFVIGRFATTGVTN
jgi:hypothetical protein